MSSRTYEPLHQGVLIQGAAGDVWFTRDDYDAPVRLTTPGLIKSVNAFSAGLGEQFMTIPLPEDIFTLLDAEHGPLSPTGIVHCKTHQMGKPPRARRP